MASASRTHIVNHSCKSADRIPVNRMVYRTVTDAAFFHTADNSFKCLRILGGITIQLHIADMTSILSNIKEELPKYDFDAMTTGELVRALKSGKKIKELVEECRDKRGKLDTDKVYLKFIDAFILSIYTAKILYGYGIQDASDPDAAAKAKAEELKKKLDGIRKSYEAKA